MRLLKLTRIEKAARELLQDETKANLLTYEQKEMLRKVRATKREAIANRDGSL